jgi:hypothetical protein
VGVTRSYSEKRYIWDSLWNSFQGPTVSHQDQFLDQSFENHGFMNPKHWPDNRWLLVLISNNHLTQSSGVQRSNRCRTRTWVKYVNMVKMMKITKGLMNRLVWIKHHCCNLWDVGSVRWKPRKHALRRESFIGNFGRVVLHHFEDYRKRNLLVMSMLELFLSKFLECINGDKVRLWEKIRIIDAKWKVIAQKEMVLRDMIHQIYNLTMSLW